MSSTYISAARYAGDRHYEDEADTKPGKRTRISAACTFCRARKARCDGAQPCGHCRSTGQSPCIYPPKSRKVDADYVAELEIKARQLDDLRHQLNISGSQPMRNPPQTRHPSPNSSIDPQFASGPLPLPLQSMYRPPDPFSPNAVANYHTHRILPPTEAAIGGLGALADAAAAEHEAVPPHFAHKRSPRLLPLSIAKVPPESENGLDQLDSLRSTDHRNQDNLVLIADTYPGASSTTALAGRVQNAATHLMGGSDRASLSTERNDPPVEPYKAGDNRFIFQHTADPNELYALPHRPLADQLLEVYEEHVHPLLPIFHWPTFKASYLAVWGSDEIDTDFLGVLNLVFANASLVVTDDVLPGNAYDTGLRFYKRALKIMYPLVLASESIAGLQCLCLMTNYLLHTPEAQLCWTTCGNCIRVAQCRGLHVPSTTEHLNPIDREVRRRIWGACVKLDSSICVTLGFPSSLSAAECIAVEPSLVDDVYLTLQGSKQPPSAPSEMSYFVEATRLSAIQVEAINALYTSKDASTSKMPIVQSILELDRSLDGWQSRLPPHLKSGSMDESVRRSRPELARQAAVLGSSALSLKMLIHRPLLFHLCSRGQLSSGETPSPMEHRIAQASAQLCSDAALELIISCLDGWRRCDVRLWGLQLYYMHSAALVILAARIVDENSDRHGSTKYRLVDHAAADLVISRALAYFAEVAGEAIASASRTFVPAAMLTGPARRTAKRCRAMLAKISEPLNASQVGRRQANGSGSVCSPISSGPSYLGAEDRYEDYARAFLELVPTTADAPSHSTYDGNMTANAGSEAATMMGQWSMHDLLTASCLPPQCVQRLNGSSSSGSMTPFQSIH